ncbi:MAG: heme-binding beta-barrel domain-containing protein [Acidimicrobiales bacterium]
MANEPWGPLAGLIGSWESGFSGLDVSFHNDSGKIAETAFREATTFSPFGPVENAGHSLYGLDYRTSVWREGDEGPFHQEVGYWMWDATSSQVMRCFTSPLAVTLIAGATVDPDATSFRLEAMHGSNTYGILSSTYLDEVARTSRFEVTVTVSADSYSYDETIVVEHRKSQSVIMHTDRNTLKRAGT